MVNAFVLRISHCTDVHPESIEYLAIPLLIIVVAIRFLKSAVLLFLAGTAFLFLVDLSIKYNAFYQHTFSAKLLQQLIDKIYLLYLEYFLFLLYIIYIYTHNQIYHSTG